MKIDEQEQKGYKIEIHHEEITGKTFLEGIEENDTGNVSESPISNNENSSKTKKFNWLFRKRS